MELLDITVPIREGMVTYPGDPTVHLERVKELERGDTANLSRLDFGVHTGTHVDAPLHFVAGGAAAETLPLDVCIGPAEVIDASDTDGDIGVEHVEQMSEGAQRVLFKTRNSELWDRDEFQRDFARISEDAARALVDRGVRLVGVDYLSVGNPTTHRTLLSAGVVAVEGLDLRRVAAGRYRLMCLPLKIVGSDGAPARAVLMAG